MACANPAFAHHENPFHEYPFHASAEQGGCRSWRPAAGPDWKGQPRVRLLQT